MRTKEVVTAEYSFNTSDKYTFDDVVDILNSLLSKARTTEPYFEFHSSMEPYEDWLGDPIIKLVEEVPLTGREARQEEEFERVMGLAKEWGVPYCDAVVLDRHKDKIK